MKYLTRSTPTDFLPFPTRLINSLRNYDINTVGEMISCYKINSLEYIRGLGRKSIVEIASFVEHITHGDGEYILVTEKEYKRIYKRLDSYEKLENTPASNLPLSVKAKAILRIRHIRNAAQLIGITEEALQINPSCRLSRPAIREIVKYAHDEL